MRVEREIYGIQLGTSPFDRLRVKLGDRFHLRSDLELSADLERSREARLPAFTLVDILAGMVIMSIVVGMVFGVFNMVNRQTHDFQNLRIELNEFVLMQADLQRQIDACENIYQVPSGFVLELQDDELKYFISENALIRQSEDSRVMLHPSVTKIDFEFEEGASDQPLITAIEIETKLREMSLTANFSKDYSNVDKINHLLLNEH
mgnify:CR=1 FL=1